jgi:hypothetical protein
LIETGIGVVGPSAPVNLDGDIYSVAEWINYHTGMYKNGKSQPAGFAYAVNDVVEVTVFNGTLTCLKNNVQV